SASMKRSLFVPAFGRRRRSMGEDQLVAVCVHSDTVAFLEFTLENLDCERILNQSLNRSPERTRAVNRIIAALGDERLGALGEIQRDLAAREIFAQTIELDIDDGGNLVAAEIVEDNRLV